MSVCDSNVGEAQRVMVNHNLSNLYHCNLWGLNSQLGASLGRGSNLRPRSQEVVTEIQADLTKAALCGYWEGQKGDG